MSAEDQIATELREQQLLDRPIDDERDDQEVRPVEVQLVAEEARDGIPRVERERLERRRRALLGRRVVRSRMRAERGVGDLVRPAKMESRGGDSKDGRLGTNRA